MTKKRPVFSPEFKREAAELVIDKGYSIYKACEARGVSESALRRWVDQLRNELTGETPESARALTAEHQEIQALKAKIRDLEEDNEILKKATALFAAQDKAKSKLSRR